MTRRTNSTVAGSAFLLYIALGIPSLILTNRATHAPDVAGKLASIAQHATDVRVAIVLILFSGFCALTLGVTLYALTRDQDRDLALIALCCRVGEGVIAAVSAVRTLQLLSVAMASTGAAAPDAAAVQAFGGLLLKQGGLGLPISATCFAVGSTLYSYLFLRARSIPVALAWLGVLASVLLVVALPLQLTGFLHGQLTYFVWIPMAVFEVTLGLWLIIKGVAMPPRRPPA